MTMAKDVHSLPMRNEFPAKKKLSTISQFLMKLHALQATTNMWLIKYFVVSHSRIFVDVATISVAMIRLLYFYRGA